MAKLGQRLNRRATALGVVVFAVVTFVSLNIVARAELAGWRLDLTQDQRFTLSAGTERVLAEIDEPITLRFYRSDDLGRIAPDLEAHADRVDDFLREYAALAGGMLEIERIAPEPFSPEEDQAVADGLRGLPTGRSGEQAYLGVAGLNMTDDREAIPFLAPERINFLEYDLTRLVHDLANPEKPVLQMVGELPLFGTPQNSFQRWAVAEDLEEVFEVERTMGDIDRIEDNVDVVLLGQPRDLSPRTAYAVDQFALQGGRVMAVLDPFFEEGAASRQPPTAFGGVDALLAAWGIEVDGEAIVGDRETGRRVEVPDDAGRPVVTTYPLWFTAGPEQFAPGEPILAHLDQLAFHTPGAVAPAEGAATRFTPLVRTTADAATFARSELAPPDPIAIMESYEPAGDARTLVARVEGEVATAFPDGPPEGAEDVGADDHLAASTAPLRLVVVADADFLADRAWLQRQQLLGQEFAVPVANNGDFAVNAAENLAGGEGLIALRGRGFDRRPFTVIDAMEREAERRFRATEQELVQRLEETEAKIDEIRAEEQEGGVLLTAAQEEAVADFRAQLIDIRAELRDVRYRLNEDVEQLKSRLRMANIWAVPAVVGVFAIGLLVWRRRQGERSAAAR
ncbi:MAG: Gldg family protein [Alphaproteobacteria bacterium]